MADDGGAEHGVRTSLCTGVSVRSASSEVLGQEHVSLALRNAGTRRAASGTRTCSAAPAAPVRRRRRASWPRRSTAPRSRTASRVGAATRVSRSPAGPRSTCTSSTPPRTTASTPCATWCRRPRSGTPGRWKVYIVDEVHMLSTAASNALLKTLEEPPGHVVFVLATTDAQKVLPTIRSRTQHFEFRLLGVRDARPRSLHQVRAASGLAASRRGPRCGGAPGPGLGARRAVGARPGGGGRRRRRRHRGARRAGRRPGRTRRPPGPGGGGPRLARPAATPSVWPATSPSTSARASWPSWPASS